MEVLSDFLMCREAVGVQVVGISVWAVVWFKVLPLLASFIRERVVNPHAMRQNWITLNRKTFKKSFMVDFNDSDAFLFASELTAVMFQHFVGGALCLPAYLSLSFVSSELAIALACHGALCEAGWEIEDMLTRIFDVLRNKDGLKRNPPTLFVIFGIHHALTLSMVIPMNTSHYRNDPAYHELILLFQLAAAIALTLQQFGYLLDVTTVSGRRMMFFVVTFSWVTIWYTRVYRTIPIFWHFLTLFYEDGAYGFLTGAAVTAPLMLILNALFAIDSTVKVVKFFQIYFATKSSDIGEDEGDEEEEEEEEREKEKTVQSPERRRLQRLLQQRSSEALLGPSLIRSASSFTLFSLTPPQKHWAKLRGAVTVSRALKKKN